MKHGASTSKDDAICLMAAMLESYNVDELVEYIERHHDEIASYDKNDVLLIKLALIKKNAEKLKKQIDKVLGEV